MRFVKIFQINFFVETIVSFFSSFAPLVRGGNMTQLPLEQYPKHKKSDLCLPGIDSHKKCYVINY